MAAGVVLIATGAPGFVSPGTRSIYCSALEERANPPKV